MDALWASFSHVPRSHRLLQAKEADLPAGKQTRAKGSSWPLAAIVHPVEAVAFEPEEGALDGCSHGNASPGAPLPLTTRCRRSGGRSWRLEAVDRTADLAEIL